jgi:hypothetical protein
MADKGIIFSAAMVRALLDGSKTQTRRLLKPRFGLPSPVNLAEHGVGSYSGLTNDPASWGWPFADDGSDASLAHFPELSGYRVGDRLYVREAWNVFSFSQDGEIVWPLDHIPTKAQFDEVEEQAYRGTWQIVHHESDRAREWFTDQKWRPSIHMPRWTSRLWLAVTDVRVQRLQAIILGDICAEGLASSIYDFRPIQRGFEAWEALWNSLHTAEGERWQDNPWVVAVSFDVHHGNIDQGAKA